MEAKNKEITYEELNEMLKSFFWSSYYPDPGGYEPSNIVEAVCYVGQAIHRLARAIEQRNIED